MDFYVVPIVSKRQVCERQRDRHTRFPWRNVVNDMSRILLHV